MEKECKFTKFTRDRNWVVGECEGYSFEAKLYDRGSEFGINDGRISKLLIRNKAGEWIANYDRGWDIKPKTEDDNAIYKAVKCFLENAPERFYEFSEFEEINEDRKNITLIKIAESLLQGIELTVKEKEKRIAEFVDSISKKIKG